jgi:hypothetical protein
MGFESKYSTNERVDNITAVPRIWRPARLIPMGLLSLGMIVEMRRLKCLGRGNSCQVSWLAQAATFSLSLPGCDLDGPLLAS